MFGEEIEQNFDKVDGRTKPLGIFTTTDFATLCQSREKQKLLKVFAEYATENIHSGVSLNILPHWPKENWNLTSPLNIFFATNCIWEWWNGMAKCTKENSIQSLQSDCLLKLRKFWKIEADLAKLKQNMIFLLLDFSNVPVAPWLQHNGHMVMVALTDIIVVQGSTVLVVNDMCKKMI